ncbi:peptide chain release factor N(5)-glutamine methyltransferase [Roseomonas sp. CCTCC AB2023176]|uniref:peptide chain release factor N(5)-glutamine methyltransferase n=1 Tax=Roseomonas sp. CCTCC AB2023176 TaxID=3342640 RepID=UPI0035DE2527
MGETVGAFLCQAGQILRAAGIEQPRFEARLLLAHATGGTQDSLLRDPRAPVPPDTASRFRALLAARAARTPVAHLLGEAGFWTLALRSTPDALVPRADTETLIEAALDARRDRAAVRRILDLGTGTGALLLAALSEFAAAAFGLGLDRSEAAARLALDNAVANRLDDRAAFAVGDWDAAVTGRFDLIFSNPPYIESAVIPDLMPDVSRYEPHLALDGGADGLDAYRALARALPRLLAPRGLAVLELGHGQEVPVSGLMHDSGLTVLACRPDLAGIPRALMLTLAVDPT